MIALSVHACFSELIDIALNVEKVQRGSTVTYMPLCQFYFYFCNSAI